MMMKKKIFCLKRRPKYRHLIWVEKITNIGEIKLKMGTHVLIARVTKYTWAGGISHSVSTFACFQKNQNISFIQALTYRKFCKALWVDFGYIHCLLDVTLDYHRCGHVVHWVCHVSLGYRGHVTHHHVSLKWHWRRAETNFSCGYYAEGSEADRRLQWWPRSIAGGGETSRRPEAGRGQSEAGDGDDGAGPRCRCCPLTTDCSVSGSRRSWRSSWRPGAGHHCSDRQLAPADDTHVTPRPQGRRRPAARARGDTTCTVCHDVIIIIHLDQTKNKGQSESHCDLRLVCVTKKALFLEV